MKTRSCLYCLTIIANMVIVTAIPLYAQSAKPSDLKSLAETLSKRYAVQILVSPDLSAPTGLLAPPADASLNAALDRLTRQIKNAAWRRLFLKPNVSVPSPEKMAAAVRALERLPQQGLGVENPSLHCALLFLPQDRTATQQAKVGAFATKPIFLLYDATAPADGRTCAERITDLQQQQSELVERLPAGQRPNPMVRGMQLLQSLDPKQGEAFLNRVGEAGMQMWQKTSPAVRDEMMQQFMETAKGSRAASQVPAPSETISAREQASRNYFNDLRRITDALAKRHKVSILLDPALRVPTPPVPPADRVSLPQALETLTKSVKGITWRRVTPQQASRAVMTIREMVAAIRVLENAGSCDFAVEKSPSHGAASLETSLEVTALREKMTAHRFFSRPLYVLYALQENEGREKPLDARLAELQSQQFEMLQSLDSGQMMQLMGQEIERYRGMSAESRAAMMHSPVMAVMMGIWFPRRAQEDREP